MQIRSFCSKTGGLFEGVKLIYMGFLIKFVNSPDLRPRNFLIPNVFVMKPSKDFGNS